MFSYYLDLALRSFRRNVALTVLMVLAIAFGVGASMTTLTVLHVLSADPIPQKSDRLFYVQLDPYPERIPYKVGDEPAEQLSRQDAETLLREARGHRQAMMVGGSAAIEPDREGLSPFFVESRWTSGDLFAMFDVPFVAGGGWTPADDTSAAHVIVISRELAEKVFGTAEAVGKELRVSGTPMRVVGVTGRWRPSPHFHDLFVGDYAKPEQLFMPFSTARELKLNRNGQMNCWDETADSEAYGAPCEWIQYWVELERASDAAAYEDYLIAYSEEQRAAGRYGHPPNVRLRNVTQHLAHNKVVPDDVRLQTWLALGFLLVCLVNTVGLLLTKFLRRSAEIGVRRALGASKRSIFVQLLVEAGAIGVAGGVLGLGLAYLGLWAVRQQPTEYAALAHLDLTMLLITFVIAIVTSLLAGLLPAWRGCQITPAIQLKSL
jgi:putative ABC transport system permease protein